MRSTIWFDGEQLRHDRVGRRFRADPRCFARPHVGGAYAHVCAAADPTATLRYDEPEVQQVRRDVLAWWIPLLGDDLVCLTTLALDASLFGGAVTVARSPRVFDDDPFARLFPGTTVQTNLFSEVPPPVAPVIERYSGLAWPAGSFRGWAER